MRRLTPALLVICAVALLAYLQLRPAPQVQIAAVPGAKVSAETHYAPERTWNRWTRSRSLAQRSLDVAMYVFTDKFLAEALLRAAHRGVAIRVYRDHSQFLEEQRHAAERGGDSSSNFFRGEPRIHLRVKANGGHDLMHLKAYLVDGALLRDGSANWSNAGLKAQDNNAHFTNDPAQVQGFYATFEGMWSRTDNAEVQ